jgi:hypothetical protein
MIQTNYGIIKGSDVLAVQEIEHRARLETVETEQQKICVASKEMLAEIQIYFTAQWRKIIKPTAAYQIWLLCRSKLMDSRPMFKRYADVAHWMHCNPFELTDEQLVGLAGNIPRVQAQKQLSQGNFSPSDYEYIYNLTLIATDDEKAALDARATAMRAYIMEQAQKGSLPQ